MAFLQFSEIKNVVWQEKERLREKATHTHRIKNTKSRHKWHNTHTHILSPNCVSTVLLECFFCFLSLSLLFSFDSSTDALIQPHTICSFFSASLQFFHNFWIINWRITFQAFTENVCIILQKPRYLNVQFLYLVSFPLPQPWYSSFSAVTPFQIIRARSDSGSSSNQEQKQCEWDEEEENRDRKRAAKFQDANYKPFYWHDLNKFIMLLVENGI